MSTSEYEMRRGAPDVVRRRLRKIPKEERQRLRRERELAEIRCDFCGASYEEMVEMIAGPGVYICSSCICECLLLLVEKWRSGPT